MLQIVQRGKGRKGWRDIGLTPIAVATILNQRAYNGEWNEHCVKSGNKRRKPKTLSFAPLTDSNYERIILKKWWYAMNLWVLGVKVIPVDDECKFELEVIEGGGVEMFHDSRASSPFSVLEEGRRREVMMKDDTKNREKTETQWNLIWLKVPCRAAV